MDYLRFLSNTSGPVGIDTISIALSENVAGELLGKTLKFSNFSGIITEVEAYICRDDPACHAAKGYTKRTSVMF
ncbi:Methylpurine-DNA glycosylase (MPG),DNA helicase, Holliday junction RuvB type, C-terminal,Formyl, partial [Cinara cedri]